MKKEKSIRITLLTCVSIFFIFHFSFLISSCARQGYPSGGPKDTKPPTSLGCTPQNESRDFTAREFTIQFDEYVVLKNPDNNVIISPPMSQKPEFSVKGKNVHVKIKDTLQDGITYLFQFKEAIADYTEGNLLPSFEYVFSTGKAMDTMMMAGNVKDARHGKAWKETVTVMAYQGPVDSAARPNYVTRCDKEGNFAFHYIAPGSYHLVAVEDKNRDLKVGDDEAVAWLDEPVAATDSVDSTRMAAMRLSVPEVRRQRVTSSAMPAKGRIVVTTAQPMRHPAVSGEQTVQRLNDKGDTLTLWCVNPTCDSAVIVIADEGLQDTLKVRYKRKRRSHGQGGPAAEPLMKSLCMGQNAYYDELWLAFLNPMVKQAEGVQAEVRAMKDSSLTHCTLTLDSTGLRARINATLKAGEDYRIRIPAAAFTDLYGNATDTLLFALKPKDYAILTVHIDNRTGSPLVAELLDAKDTVVATKAVVTSQVRFDHIAAGNYRLRVVVDSDGDGRWTAGSYPLRRQPEDFIYYDKPLQLHERWEMEERWEIKNGK